MLEWWGGQRKDRTGAGARRRACTWCTWWLSWLKERRAFTPHRLLKCASLRRAHSDQNPAGVCVCARARPLFNEILTSHWEHGFLIWLHGGWRRWTAGRRRGDRWQSWIYHLEFSFITDLRHVFSLSFLNSRLKLIVWWLDGLKSWVLAVFFT